MQLPMIERELELLMFGATQKAGRTVGQAIDKWDSFLMASRYVQGHNQQMAETYTEIAPRMLQDSIDLVHGAAEDLRGALELNANAHPMQQTRSSARVVNEFLAKLERTEEAMRVVQPLGGDVGDGQTIRGWMTTARDDVEAEYRYSMRSVDGERVSAAALLADIGDFEAKSAPFHEFNTHDWRSYDPGRSPQAASAMVEAGIGDYARGERARDLLEAAAEGAPRIESWTRPDVTGGGYGARGSYLRQVSAARQRVHDAESGAMDDRSVLTREVWEILGHVPASVSAATPA